MSVNGYPLSFVQRQLSGYNIFHVWRVQSLKILLCKHERRFDPDIRLFYVGFNSLCNGISYNRIECFRHDIVFI